MQIVTKNTLNTKTNLPNPSPPNVLLEGRGSEEHWWPLGQRETQSYRRKAKGEEDENEEDGTSERRRGHKT